MWCFKFEDVNIKQAVSDLIIVRIVNMSSLTCRVNDDLFSLNNCQDVSKDAGLF